jgi:hypothetical protein
MVRGGQLVSLRNAVEAFIQDGARAEDLYALIDRCIADGTIEGLSCMRRLYESDYGGITFNFELKAPAALSMLIWGQTGARALVDAALADPTSKNLSLCIQILSSVAAGFLPLIYLVHHKTLFTEIDTARKVAPKFDEYCRALLIEVILSFDSDDDVAARIGHVMSQMSFSEETVGASKEVFAALSSRWLAVSKPVLRQYESLIATTPNNESAFQSFLSMHAQLLDPMAAQIWPQPDLYGFRFPDFIVRRADNTYVVIEIETPGKSLVTKAGQLSAEVTQAEKQATDYRSNLIRRFNDIQQHLPNFDEPDCLVIIGLERDLNVEQRTALADANRHRNRLRIVGFDWLADLARVVAANITRQHIQVTPLRIV